MRILIVGLGSIGTRHAKCLDKTGQVEIAVLRTAKGTLKEKSSYQEFYQLADALAYQPDGVIISNPTSLHVETAIPFLKKGIRTLIEKPLAHTVTNAEKLAPYHEKLRVAYCFRFLPLTNFIKEKIDSEKAFKLSFKRSYYLPKWHPYADYRKEYTARKDLGGGVIRTLSHEIDLMVHFFGTPVSTTGIVDKISPLEIDTDDFAFFSCRSKTGARINFELDFFSPQNINSGELFTDRGKYQWDTRQLSFASFEQSTPAKVHGSELFDYNDMYQLQMEDFITFVRSGQSQNAVFQDSMDVLKIIESIDAA